MPVTLRGKTIFDIQATISFKKRQFHEKSATKSTIAGTHTGAQTLRRARDRTGDQHLDKILLETEDFSNV